jgi:hypothetical protein
MNRTSDYDCPVANGRRLATSVNNKDLCGPQSQNFLSTVKIIFSLLMLSTVLYGCGTDASKPTPQTEAKPAVPAVPEEITAAARKLLGSETQVLLFGDLAKNGKQQFLAANVVPKTPTNNLPGTIITRAVVVENTDGKWSEIFRCDEHLKNTNGFLGGSPFASVTGWRLQYEQSDMKGLELYITPLKGTGDSHPFPIGVRWNPETKRYQSLDRNYEHFLLEASTLENPRSRLR